MLVKNIEIGTDAIDTSRGDTDVIMEETLVPIVTDRIGSTSLNDLVLSIAENQITSWSPDIKGIMQQFLEYDNEGYNISKCLFDVEQNSKLHFMTCGEVFLFGLNNPFGSVYFYQLFKKQMAKAPHTTISGIYKTNARQRKILTVFKYTGIVF